MKAIWKFVKTTVTGGLLFLIPVMLILIVLNRAFQWLRPLLRPLVVSLDVDSVLGVTILTALCLLALGFVCFVAGLAIRLDKDRKIRRGFEDLVLKFLPGFEYLKVMAGEVEGTDMGHQWQAGLLADGDAWVIAFIVEEHANGRTTVFVPESPRADSGNTKIIETTSMQFQPLGMREAYAALRHYGAGVGSKLPVLRK
jgi:uncharacterized membrane protein